VGGQSYAAPLSPVEPSNPVELHVEPRREYLPYLPVVVCTGAASPEEVSQLRRLGVRRFLHKPVALDDLLAALRAALVWDASGPWAARQSTRPTPAP
jgi:DNA-binding NarL/FixJ family response regulator